ncbi:hypothetical protein [Actinoplanes sp. NBRC 101535]|uniref:hypothetical protein n=1 Tax=Actinoplanes sp. NBRC 101535 TaxID=3032196 RepID=UPI0024A0EC22|nr:hypothetical protein [Actinoplanes sp. NBRC 101535]GLY08299.1 hypothetical protein Acsp01_86780 [Actinoplanes sp. NBRC 101535]
MPTTTARPARLRSTLTPLDPALTVKAPRQTEAGLTGLETWEATSADHQWHYIRDDGGSTPWTALYKPLGIGRDHLSLAAARAWSFHTRAALADLRAEAQQTVDRHGARTGVTTLVPGPGGMLRRVEEDPVVVAARLVAAQRTVQLLDAALADGAPQ